MLAPKAGAFSTNQMTPSDTANAIRGQNQASSGSGRPMDWDYLHGRYFSGRVPALAIGRGALNLDEHYEVRAVGKRVGNRCFVRRETIGGDLEGAIRRDGVTNAFNKNIGGGLVPLTHFHIADLNVFDALTYDSLAIFAGKHALAVFTEALGFDPAADT